MDQKYGEFVGVDNLYYAPITVDSSGAYTAGTPVYLAPVAEIAGAPEVNNVTTYYDNKAGNNYVTEGKTELKVVVSNIPADVMARLLGKHYDEANGRVYDNGQANPPMIALGFRYNKGTDGYRYFWYFKGTLSGGSEDATSKSADVDIKTYELTFTAITTTYEWVINAVSQALKRIFGDTSDAAFSATGWFSEVQTPDTIGEPSAIALSSSVPADEATDISKTAGIVLTFNNKINSEAVTIINTTSGDVVPVTKVWDGAGKVLTLTPVSAMAGTVKHIIAINGIIDVYGQALAASSREFTTIA